MSYSKRFLSMVLFIILIFAHMNVSAAEKLMLADGTAIPRKIACNKTFVVKYTGSEAVYYTINNTLLAKINNDTGEVTTLNPGEIRIAALSKSDNQEKAFLTINIKRRAEAVKLNYGKIYFAKDYGGSFGSSFDPSFKSTLEPDDSTDIVRYYSDNEDIIDVRSQSGNVTAKKSGSAVITAVSLFDKLSDKTDSENVTATAQVFAHEHNYNGSSYTPSDSFYHYRKCKNDGCTIFDNTKKMNYSEHRFYNNICMDCGYTQKPLEGHIHAWTTYGYDKTKHWLVCDADGCEATKSPEIHNFDSNNKCSVCGIEHEHNSWEELYSLDSTAHWYSCEKCDARKNMIYHHTNTVGDCKTAVSCSDCDANYGFGNHTQSQEWTTSQSNHSKRCTVCQKQLVSDVHTWTRDGDDKIKCSVCAFSHTHTWGEWTAESYGHKHSCSTQMLNSLGKAIAFENEIFAHEFDSDGICTVCKYVYDPTATDNVYEINSLYTLLQFANEVNRGKSSLNAILTDDVDMQNIEDLNIIIGESEGTPFRGIFDGNGKEIKNMNLPISQDNAGLFGVVDGGTVKNLTLSGKITLSSENQYRRIGGVAGTAKNGAVFSEILSSVNISGDAPANHVGGIVGSSQLPSEGSLKIEKCIYSGNINVPNVSDCIGGILGYANNNVTITNCGFIGNVTAKNGGHTGGILGYINNKDFGKLTNCYSAGKSSGAAIVGTVKNCSSNIENNIVSAGATAYGGNNGTKYSALYTDDWFSGDAAWKLNNSKYDGSQVWYQDIGSSYPAFSGKTVYLAGCSSGKNIYTNELPKAAVTVSSSDVTVMYADSPCILVIALYKDGKLIDIISDSVSEPTTKYFKSYGLNMADADTIKAMIFSDLNAVSPLCISSEN